MARYEVVAAVGDMEQPDEWGQQAPRSIGHPLSIYIPQQPGTSTMPSTRTSPATDSTTSATSLSVSSTASTSSASSASSASSSSSSEYVLPAASSAHLSHSLATSSTVHPSVSRASALASPSHIAQLQSASAPTYIDSVTDLTILGEGSSGVVYRGMYRGVEVVVKLPKSASLTGAGAAWRELQCHARLPPHPNLVRFLGALPMSATNYLVLGFVRQGGLHSLLSSSASTATGGAWHRRPYGVMRCMRDMAAVLQHIHRAGIVHRDVSARNILVDSDGSMVLADLGLAVQMPAASTATGQQQSTASHHRADADTTAVPVRWTSPEALASSQRYDSKSDVWSLGVALWECTAGGALPYGELSVSTKECIRPIIAGQWRLQVDERWGRDGSVSAAEQRLADSVRAMIALCLTYDWQQRLDSEQLMAVVEREWQKWRREADEDAYRLDMEWTAYHAEVQRRLGAPTEFDTVTPTSVAAPLSPKPLPPPHEAPSNVSLSATNA